MATFSVDLSEVSRFDSLFQNGSTPEHIYDIVLRDMSTDINHLSDPLLLKKMASVFGNSYFSLRRNRNYDYLFEITNPEELLSAFNGSLEHMKKMPYEQMFRMTLLAGVLTTLSMEAYEASATIIANIYRTFLILEELQALSFISPGDDIVGKMSMSSCLLN